MASNGKRGGGDRILESRHLVGLFLGVVLLCGVFFTLGYVMGRTQFAGSVHAEDLLKKPTSAPAKTKNADPSPAPAAGEWDFYSKEKSSDRPEPAAPVKSSSRNAAPSTPDASPSVIAPKASAPESKTPARFQAPVLSKTSIVLQVAALRRQSDALEMAEVIQQKKFPSFVVTPDSDNLYRVQVGPFSDIAAAESAKYALEQFGFKPIIKR